MKRAVLLAALVLMLGMGFLMEGEEHAVRDPAAQHS